MFPMMVEILASTPNHESVKEIQATVNEFVDRLTGKQTIYQMNSPFARKLKNVVGNPQTR